MRRRRDFPRANEKRGRTAPQPQSSCVQDERSSSRPDNPSQWPGAVCRSLVVEHKATLCCCSGSRQAIFEAWLPFAAFQRDIIRKGVEVNPADIGIWTTDWIWSLLLIILNVIIHVLGLGFINGWVVSTLSGAVERRHFLFMFVVIMGCTAAL